MKLDSAISRLYDLNVGTTPLEEGERTRPRVPIPAPPPESFSGKRMFLRDTSPGRTPKTIGGGADGNTRGRVCSPMDRDLIAPAPDYHWHVTKILDPRRSTGEKELIELAGKSVLLPKDPAFHPDRIGLEWRCQRLIALSRPSSSPNQKSTIVIHQSSIHSPRRTPRRPGNGGGRRVGGLYRLNHGTIQKRHFRHSASSSSLGFPRQAPTLPDPSAHSLV